MIFNLKNNEKIKQYQNKMMFIMYNYPYETYEIIIKFISSKDNIKNIGSITIGIFSKNYNDNSNKKEYNFLEKYKIIFDVMIENIEKYIDNIIPSTKIFCTGVKNVFVCLHGPQTTLIRFDTL